MADQIFTIIVADDETELREAICSLIDWKAAGFELAGSAGNGLEALQLAEKLQPDLLLTDIRMPFISGTALARQVKEVAPLIQVAFLSGYDDFEFARSAIDSQVISYLLKPISMAELTAALKEIHVKMEERLRDLSPAEEEGTDLSQTVSSVLLDVYGEIPKEVSYRQLMESGMIFTEPYKLAVTVVRVSGSGILSSGAARAVDRIIRRTYSCGSFVLGRQIISLIASEDNFARLNEMLDVLYLAAERFTGKECAVGVSSVFDSLDLSCAALKEAAELVRQAEGSGISRMDRGQSPQPRADSIGALVDGALRIIEEKYADEALTLSEVSDQLHVSPNYLSANMKKYAGDTFINLLIRKRMAAAESLIRNGGLKIAEVAQRCGYSDQHYFSYCFKKYYGVSPAKMRRGDEDR